MEINVWIEGPASTIAEVAAIAASRARAAAGEIDVEPSE